MTVALAFLPGTGQAAVAHHHPGPAQGRVVHYPNGVVIHYLAHPVGPVAAPTGPQADTAATAHNLYLICETSTNPLHCLSLDSASTTILVTALITTICQFVDCPEMLRAITSAGSNHDQGDVTFQAEGTYSHHYTNYFHDCVGANPTASDGHDNVWWSRPSKCFSNLPTSWKYTIEPGKGYRYDMINRYADTVLHRVLVMANLNLRQGAYLYVKPNVQPGLWTTWGFYLVGTCNPC